MNKNLNKLCKIGNAPRRLIIGLMSGTSLDGLDIALCSIAGSGLSTSLELLHFTTIPYTPFFQQQVKEVFAQQHTSLEKVCLLNEWIGRFHGQLVLDSLKQWGVTPEEVDLIASHGQTIYHAPVWMHKDARFPHATLQIGDGDHLAHTTGIITIADFRQKHLAAGGEGAPLAVYGDHLIFSKKGENRIMLNIGGIANFTYLPGTADISKIFSTDTGPGNTMMDAYAQRYFNQSCDRDAAIALSGNCNESLLKALLSHSFFSQSFPATTGPELFNLEYLRKAQEETGSGDISHEDVMCTLNRFTAQSIAQAMLRCCPVGEKMEVYASGGGMHNPLVMQQLKEMLPDCNFQTTEQLSVHPDAKEAVLFALLANETVAGNPDTYAGSGEGIPAICMGKISFPD